jgi:hypothetical protein
MLTAFTVGHSASLALATLAGFAPSPRLVEPAVALSVAYVGGENVLARDIRRRWMLTLPFGFVHGFALAGGLLPLGLPRGQLPAALFAFNLGVEVGQLTVVALLLPPLTLLCTRAWYARIARAASGAIVAAGLAWFVERIASPPPRFMSASPVAALCQPLPRQHFVFSLQDRHPAPRQRGVGTGDDENSLGTRPAILCDDGALANAGRARSHSLDVHGQASRPLEAHSSEFDRVQWFTPAGHLVTRERRKPCDSGRTCAGHQDSAIAARLRSDEERRHGPHLGEYQRAGEPSLVALDAPQDHIAKVEGEGRERIANHLGRQRLVGA